MAFALPLTKKDTVNFSASLVPFFNCCTSCPSKNCLIPKISPAAIDVSAVVQVSFMAFAKPDKSVTATCAIVNLPAVAEQSNLYLSSVKYPVAAPNPATLALLCATFIAPLMAIFRLPDT